MMSPFRFSPVNYKPIFNYPVFPRHSLDFLEQKGKRKRKKEEEETRRIEWKSEGDKLLFKYFMLLLLKRFLSRVHYVILERNI